MGLRNETTGLGLKTCLASCSIPMFAELIKLGCLLHVESEKLSDSLVPRMQRPLGRQRSKLHARCGSVHLNLPRAVLAIKSHLDEVTGEGEFIERERAILVHVGQRPYLADAGMTSQAPRSCGISGERDTCPGSRFLQL